MKQAINYAYNLDIDDLVEYKDYGYFILDGNKYFFVPLKRSVEELKDIIDCSRELKQKGIECHDIILNKDGGVISKNGNNDYILLRVVGNTNEEYSISDIVNQNNKLNLTDNKSKLYRNNWGALWSSKVDYFEYQISEIGKSKKVILDSFSYYVGLAENAISYVNQTLKNIAKTNLDLLTLSHRRIFYPNIKLNYLNPLSFIFDLEIRDVAEYIKSLFFNSDDAYGELERYLRLRKLSPFSYQLLYARLLYPSYYFDKYEEIMNNEGDQECLIKIINESSNYELFLKKVYYLILKYAPIEKIDWIANKKEL